MTERQFMEQLVVGISDDIADIAEKLAAMLDNQPITGAEALRRFAATLRRVNRELTTKAKNEPVH